MENWSIDDVRWQAATAGLTGALYASPAWWAAMEAEYGFAPRVSVLLNDDGTIRSGLAHVTVDDARGLRTRSVPFSDMTCGPMAAADWPTLVAALGHDQTPSQIWIKHDGAPLPGWQKAQPCVWQYIPVDGERDDMLERCNATTRNRVRGAERNGFVVSYDTTAEAVDDFHQLHVGVRKHKHRLLAQGVSLFQHQRSAFAGSFWVTRVRRDNRTEAAAIVVEYDGVLYYKYAASRPEFRSLGVNQRLVFAVIELALERGLRLVDLGRSDVDQPGLVDFKRRLGAHSEPLYRFDRSGVTTHAGDECGATLGRLTELLIGPKVDDGVTAAAGAELYRFFA